MGNSNFFQCILHQNEAAKDLLSDMELVKEMLPTILDMKNAKNIQKCFFFSKNCERYNDLF